MKELYIAPEVKLICLASAEKLANNNYYLDFDSMLSNSTYDPTKESEIDVDVNLPGLG